MQGNKKMGAAEWSTLRGSLRGTLRGTLGSTLALLAAGAGLAGCGSAPRAVPPTKAVMLYKTCVKPEYPRAAVRRESQGTVSLAFYVEPDGRVSDSRIAKSAGDALLDEAALRSLKTCRFKPATENGKPVGQWAPIQYVWSLSDSDGKPLGR